MGVMKVIFDHEVTSAKIARPTFPYPNGHLIAIREEQKAYGLALPRPAQYHLVGLQKDGLIERVSCPTV
jgi:hypothetical protein